jgi:hypothetical protein
MLPMGTKQSGGKLLPHSDLRGGLFLRGVSRSRQIKRKNEMGWACGAYWGGDRCAQGVGGEV